MRLRITTLVAACALILLAPATAYADHGQTVDDPTVAQYMRIAAAHWGGQEPRCTARNGQSIAPHAVMANDPDPAVGAWAELPGCRIWLDSTQWRLPATPSESFCNLITHEWGHLLGHDHSPDPNSLMSGSWVPNVVVGCQVFRPGAPSRPASPPPPPRRRKLRDKRTRNSKRCVRVRQRGRSGGRARRRYRKSCVRKRCARMRRRRGGSAKRRYRTHCARKRCARLKARRGASAKRRYRKRCARRGASRRHR